MIRTNLPSSFSLTKAMVRTRPIKNQNQDDVSSPLNLLLQGCSVSVPFAVLIVSVSLSAKLSWVGSLLSVAAACTTSWLASSVWLDVCNLSKSEGNLNNGLYAVIGELMAFLSSWLELLVRGCMIGVSGRTLSHTVDLVVGPSLHQAVIHVFGLTPYLNTFPDLLAGSTVVCTSIIIEVGLEVYMDSYNNTSTTWTYFSIQSFLKLFWTSALSSSFFSYLHLARVTKLQKR